MFLKIQRAFQQGDSLIAFGTSDLHLLDKSNRCIVGRRKCVVPLVHLLSSNTHSVHRQKHVVSGRTKNVQPLRVVPERLRNGVRLNFDHLLGASTLRHFQVSADSLTEFDKLPKQAGAKAACEQCFLDSPVLYLRQSLPVRNAKAKRKGKNTAHSLYPCCLYFRFQCAPADQFAIHVDPLCQWGQA